MDDDKKILEQLYRDLGVKEDGISNMNSFLDTLYEVESLSGKKKYSNLSSAKGSYHFTDASVKTAKNRMKNMLQSDNLSPEVKDKLRTLIEKDFKDLSRDEESIMVMSNLHKSPTAPLSKFIAGEVPAVDLYYYGHHTADKNSKSSREKVKENWSNAIKRLGSKAETPSVVNAQKESEDYPFIGKDTRSFKDIIKSEMTPNTQEYKEGMDRVRDAIALSFSKNTEKLKDNIPDTNKYFWGGLLGTAGNAAASTATNVASNAASKTLTTVAKNALGSALKSALSNNSTDSGSNTALFTDLLSKMGSKKSDIQSGDIQASPTISNTNNTPSGNIKDYGVGVAAAANAFKNNHNGPTGGRIIDGRVNMDKFLSSEQSTLKSTTAFTDAAGDLIGNVFPVAKVYKSLGKLAMKAGSAIGGEKGGRIAAGMFDPFSTGTAYLKQGKYLKAASGYLGFGGHNKKDTEQEYKDYMHEYGKLFRAVNDNRRASMYDNAFVNTAADGGLLNNMDPNLDVKVQEFGGTHETNPHGGVTVGFDPQGKKNQIEEDEVVVGDFVFSNRIPYKK